MCDQHVGTVRRPGPRVCEGLVTFQERESVNVETALLQWLDYVETFRRHGWKIAEVEPADDCPDAVFIEVWSGPLLSFAAPFIRCMQDCVVFFGSTAVITRPGAVSRRLEIPAVERLVRTLGCRCISSRFITLPETRRWPTVLQRDVYP